MTDQEELWFAEATLGRDAEEFAKSQIGRFILGRCDQEIADARDKLDTVAVWRKNRIRELQNDIWRAKSVKGWIAELIIRGKEAENQIESSEYQSREI